MALAALRSAAAKPPRLALPRFAMSAAAAAASSSAAKSAPAVVHEAARSRFAVKHEAGDAVLEYRTSEAQGTRTMDMYRTYVPNQFRGQGVAGLLATAAFEFAKREKYQVIPTCSYISDTFLPKNPQWQELVRKPSQL